MRIPTTQPQDWSLTDRTTSPIITQDNDAEGGAVAVADEMTPAAIARSLSALLAHPGDQADPSNPEDAAPTAEHAPTPLTPAGEAADEAAPPDFVWPAADERAATPGGDQDDNPATVTLSPTFDPAKYLDPTAFANTPSRLDRPNTGPSAPSPDHPTGADEGDQGKTWDSGPRTASPETIRAMLRELMDLRDTDR